LASTASDLVAGDTNGFEDVSGWFVTTSWLFYGLTTAAHLVANLPRSQPYTRLLNRMWTRFKSGR
jgi:hypothetical protein